MVVTDPGGVRSQKRAVWQGAGARQERDAWQSGAGQLLAASLFMP